MQLQISTDYAIRVLGYLYINDGELVTAVETAKYLGITPKYFMKIINKLKKANLVESMQGRNGGYRLGKAAMEISLYDIIVIMEKTAKLNRCLEKDHYCSRNASSYCTLHKTWESMQKKFERMLKRQLLYEIWNGSKKL